MNYHVGKMMGHGGPNGLLSREKDIILTGMLL